MATPNVPQSIRVAIYARVSTKGKGQDTENQLAQLRAFAATQGWTVFREFVDHETGSKSDRAEFQAMFFDDSQRKFDLLLFWALDRLSREGVLETLQHLNRLTSYGIGFRSFAEQYFDSCGVFKDAVIAIMATLGRWSLRALFFAATRNSQGFLRSGKGVGDRDASHLLSILKIFTVKNSTLTLDCRSDDQRIVPRQLKPGTNS
jgi:hypothetical protein